MQKRRMVRIGRMALLGLTAATCMTGCLSRPSWYGTWYGWPEVITVYDEHTNAYETLQFRVTQHPEAANADVYEDFVARAAHVPILVDDGRRCLPPRAYTTNHQAMVHGVIAYKFIRAPGSRTPVQRSLFTNMADAELVIRLED